MGGMAVVAQHSWVKEFLWQVEITIRTFGFGLPSAVSALVGPTGGPGG